MAIDSKVLAIGPDGKKRRVPKHYLTNPAFGFRAVKSAQDAETEATVNARKAGNRRRVTEPAQDAETEATAAEPAKEA